MIARGNLFFSTQETFETALDLLDSVAPPLGEGTVWNTKRERFAYKEAALDATDYHVKTRGGVPLYVLPSDNGFNVKAFGAVGDGFANDTIAFSKAMEVLAEQSPPKKLIANGKFRIDLETSWNVSDDTTLDWSGATFIPAQEDTTKLFLQIRGRRNGRTNKANERAVAESVTTLASDALKGAVFIDVSNPSGIEEGDLLVLVSNEKFQKQANKNKTQEPARVSSVVGSRIYLDASLLCDFTGALHQAEGGVGLPEVHVYKTAQKVEFIGGTWDIRERCSRALEVSEINLAVFRGQRFINPLRRGIEIRLCSGDTHYDPICERHGADPSTDADAAPSFGYSVMHTFCCYSRVFAGQGRRGWHSFDATQGQRDITYYNFIGQMESQSISSHADCILFRVVGCQIEGRASVHCRARYSYVENCRITGVAAGAGVEWGSDSYEMHLLNSVFSGNFGNAYSVNATIGIRPTHAEIRKNSKAIIRGNTFSGVGGNISLFRGASKIVVENNLIECDDFATTVSKISGYLFADGVGVCSKNTILNPVGGGRAVFSLWGETGSKWTANRNDVIGSNAHKSSGDIFSITTNASISYNSIDTDYCRYFIKVTGGVVLDSVSFNDFLASNSNATLVHQNDTNTSTVGNFVGNNTTSTISRKTSTRITISKEFNNIYSDT